MNLERVVKYIKEKFVTTIFVPTGLDLC